MNQRQTTWETIKQLDVQDFDGQIEDLIDRLGSLRAIVYSRGFHRVRIDLHETFDNLGSLIVEYYLRGERYMTDEEVKAQEAAKTRVTDRERALYEQLKKKFEGQS